MLSRCALGVGALALAVVAVSLVVGCGSSQKPATLPPALAARLAAASDTVAADLGRRDMCAAAAHAASLRAASAAAIRAGQVPTTLAPELTRRVRLLAAAIHCTPPPAQPQPRPQPQQEEDKHDRGKHKGDKNHDKGGEGDKG
jgi:hypothetical protein